MSVARAHPTRSRPAPAFDPRRVFALISKEGRQIMRDPSTIIMAFVLPLVLLFLFAFAVSLDIDGVRLALVLEDDGAAARDLAAGFAATPFFDVVPTVRRDRAADLLVAGNVRGIVVIPQGFDRRLAIGDEPRIQVLTDGSQPNTASIIAGYADGVLASWAAARAGAPAPPISLEPRVWFNPELVSRRFLVPGAIAIVMTIIGTLLTALVIAREWERGTMEAIMATPAGVFEVLLGKLVPYFALGLVATIGSAALATLVFDVPLRGSPWVLLLLSSVFLVPALSQGLLISTLARNQFVASQLALLSGFLPAFLLSGFLFQIESMPRWIQLITYVLPARHFVSSLQTVFLAGDVWSIFWPNILAMLALGTGFMALLVLNTHKRLDR